MNVLDPCCGSRMMWFDKADQRTLFGDCRKETHILPDRQYQRHLEIKPDVKRLAERHQARLFGMLPSARSKRHPDFQVERKPDSGERDFGVNRPKTAVWPHHHEAQEKPNGHALVYVYERIE